MQKAKFIQKRLSVTLDFRNASLLMSLCIKRIILQYSLNNNNSNIYLFYLFNLFFLFFILSGMINLMKHHKIISGCSSSEKC